MNIPPQIPIYIVGFMGAGKSSVGRRLARLLDREFIDTDLYIENRFRKKISAMFEQEGEQVFRKREKLAIEEVAGYYNAVIATGGGLACHYNNMEVMKNSGVTVYLQYSLPFLTNRLASCYKGRPVIASLEGEEFAPFIMRKFEQREPYYLMADLRVDCELLGENATEDEIAQHLYTLLTDPLFTCEAIEL